MTTLNKEARQSFWTRKGTFGIVGSFEAEGKLSSMLLKQCLEDGVSAAPVSTEIDEAQGVRAVGDPGQIEDLAGIVCVRLDPHATQAVEKGAELGVPVWLSLRVASDESRAAAERTGADVIEDACPLMYLDSGSFHSVHRFVAKVFRSY
jgi:predicted CoA-binding protein